MKKLAISLLTLMLLGSTFSLTGCSYGSIATAGDDKVVITRNDYFLFGALRKVFVCRVSSRGITRCGNAENP